MSQYQQGAVSVTNGSNIVTGSGTAWQTAGIISSNILTKDGDNVAYSIASVDSDTQITLTANYGGSTSSDSNYGITIDFTPNGLPLLSSGDLNTDAIYNEAMLSIDNDFSSLGTAASKDLTSPSATIWDDGNLVKTISSTDTTSGSILKVGDFGLGDKPVTYSDANSVGSYNHFVEFTSTTTNTPIAGRFFDGVCIGVNDFQDLVVSLRSASSPESAQQFRKSNRNGVWTDWVREWDSGNTIVDINGFLKEV